MFIGVSVRVLYYVIIRKNHIFKKNQKKILRLFKRNLDKRQGGGLGGLGLVVSAAAVGAPWIEKSWSAVAPMHSMEHGPGSYRPLL